MKDAIQNMKKIKSIKGKIVCEAIQRKSTLGIILPDGEEEFENDRAIILDITKEDSEELGVVVGDEILFTRMLGYQKTIDEKKYYIVNKEIVLGKISE